MLAARQPTFKAGTAVVPVYVTVIDTAKRLVPDLVKEDFDILDNGKSTPVVLFDAEVQPITVVVMLDTSGSMTGSIDLLRAAAEQFVFRLLPQDKGRIGAFNDKIEFTSDSPPIATPSSARSATSTSGTRPALRRGGRLPRRAEAVLGPEVVLVFTDGDDTYSKVGMGHVLDRARVEEVMIYAIGLQSDYFNGQQRMRTRPDRGLKKLAEETGGGYFELKDTDELGPTFTRVAQELHSQSRWVHARDRRQGPQARRAVKKPGMSARARRSYQAPGSGTK